MSDLRKLAFDWLRTNVPIGTVRPAGSLRPLDAMRHADVEERTSVVLIGILCAPIGRYDIGDFA